MTMKKDLKLKIKHQNEINDWIYACQHYYHLNEKNALLWVERSVGKKILKIARKDKDGSFREAMHRVIDKKNIWLKRLRTMGNHPKCTQHREELPQHGIVISLIGSGVMTIDVGNMTSYMRMEYLYAKDRFGNSILSSLPGKKIGDVFETPDPMQGVLNLDRKIIRAGYQINKTVIRFEEEETIGITYKQLLGDPLERYQQERRYA